MLSLPLALISLHQWGWGMLGWDISSAIQQHRYLTGSDLSLPGLAWDHEQDWLGDAATAGTLSSAPPVGARLHWVLLVGVGSLAVKLGASFCSGVAPSAKKWVRSEGKSGSLPSSLSISSQTCFLGLSSFCREASCHYALSLDSWDFGCNVRFSMECWSCSSGGQDHGGLGEGDWYQLGCEGEGLWCHLNPLLPLELVLLLPNWGSSVLLFYLKGLILLIWTSGAPLASGGQLSWPPFTS